MDPYIYFKQVNPPGPPPLRALLGDARPVVTAPSGWTTVQRPKEFSFIDYTGADPITMDLSIIFDGYANETSVELLVGRLFGIMRTRTGPRNEPAVVQIGGVPVPYYGVYWVINSITTGDEIRRSSDGARIRAMMTVQLLQYLAGSVLLRGQKPSPAKTRRATKSRSTAGLSHGAATRVYVVKHGDTLSKIAAHYLGRSSRWPEIAKLNNLRDPNRINIGQKLKIPKS